MLKWIHANNKVIFSIIITSVICFSAGVIAEALISADSVSYSYAGTTKTNVKDVLDELYDFVNVGDATAADIAEGKKALVNGSLLTGTLKVGAGNIAEVVWFHTASNGGYQAWKIRGDGSFVWGQSGDTGDYFQVNRYSVVALKACKAAIGNYASDFTDVSVGQTVCSSSSGKDLDCMIAAIPA